MKILIEISGGFDSGAAALKSKEMFLDSEFYGFMVNYGQIPFEIEYKKAKEFCKRENIKLKVIEIKNLFDSGTVKGNDNKDENGIANIYTPFRNGVILSSAISYAENIGAEYIITGSKGLNDDGGPYSFKDSLLPFYELMNAVVNYAVYKKIKILPILTYKRNIKMTKKEVYKYLNDKGYGINDFWNCFNSNEKICGVCNNCIELNKLRGVFNDSSKN